MGGRVAAAPLLGALLASILTYTVLVGDADHADPAPPCVEADASALEPPVLVDPSGHDSAPLATARPRESDDDALALAAISADAGTTGSVIAACLERGEVRDWLEAEVARRHAAESRAEDEMFRADARLHLARVEIGDPELDRLAPSVCGMWDGLRVDSEGEVDQDELLARARALDVEIHGVLGDDRALALERLGGTVTLRRAIGCRLATPE